MSKFSRSFSIYNIYIVSNALKNFHFVIQNEKWIAGIFSFWIINEADVAAFPSGLVEINQSGVHSQAAALFINFTNIRRQNSGNQWNPTVEVPLQLQAKILQFFKRLQKLRFSRLDGIFRLFLQMPKRRENDVAVAVTNRFRQRTPALRIFHFYWRVVWQQKGNAFFVTKHNCKMQCGIAWK